MFERLKNNLGLDGLKEFLLSPSSNEKIKKASEVNIEGAPKIMLLGKTGSGKSSLVSEMTGNEDVEIGKGFKPCTMSLSEYAFPSAEKPLLKFIDTRGVGEAGFDHEESIAKDIEQFSPIAMTVIVAKLDDPEQDISYKLLKEIPILKNSKKLLLLTGLDLVEEPEKIIEHHKDKLSKFASDFECVAVDFKSSKGIESLDSCLLDMLPILEDLMEKKAHSDQESQNFDKIKNEVLWYAGLAGGSDAIPVVGAVSVPAIQGKMLYDLATKYELEWDRKLMMEFFSCLGMSFALSYLASFGTRQLSKMVPVLGQTAGSAASAAIGFASTYAIGRVACMYFYHKSRGEAIDGEKLREEYKRVFTERKQKQ